FMITNDSGPMHIAAALGVPTYAIFGPTSPVLTGPYGQGHTIIRSIRTDDDCSPCFKRSCEDTKCMEGVSPAQVLGAIKKKSGLTF
ncbi:MAG TPA: lipopolysaccharide heptosyltransferase I, partial [Nitrospirae bacterium]|nr:lipopolysaccharide heptosyltransferase I [Nitrospirota bacterium]